MPTHPNYYVLIRLGNIMRVEILNLNFSIKESKMYQKLKRKITGLRYIRDSLLIVRKLQRKLTIHKTVYK